jgi:hypothetical protein
LLISNNKGMGNDIYQVCPRWCLIVAFFIFFYVDTFLKIFHLTRVCKSPCSPSKNSWICACGIYAHSMEILFVLPCHSPFFHTKFKFDNGDFVGFWTSILCHLGVHPMIMIIQNVPYKKGTISKPINMDKTCITPTCLQTLIFHTNTQPKPYKSYVHWCQLLYIYIIMKLKVGITLTFYIDFFFPLGNIQLSIYFKICKDNTPHFLSKRNDHKLKNQVIFFIKLKT